ncbi:MAG: hypothetical protein RMK51_10410 [Meiothermus sp.]|uniref:hypothetical protein n=1 Tax=Meiothermus sp. TaxID=1955249 RepID=UPI0025FF3146|nr:hypothetical protein [Meiothermus sp.]MCS7068085.1 hypothetical protein [Meiothermus sp.]MDW8426337.1 hypothetical protein [Meiothermus sp.]
MAQVSMGRLLKPLRLGLVTMALLGMGFVAGRLSAQPGPGGSLEARQGVRLQPVQFDRQQLLPAPDPRELIPLQPGPGQGPGQPQPGQGQEECPILIYQDGQLYRFDLPGPQMPGPGGLQPGPGLPGGSPELIPLEPGTPSLPGPPSSPTPSPAPTPPEANPDQSI